MSIKFYNIRSKEIREALIEPHIAAMWASSDRGPNSGDRGQDFGWRLAPEVVVELKAIKQDENKLLMIANRYRLMLEDVGEKEILMYISDKTDSAKAAVASDEDYTDVYNDEIRALEGKTKSKSQERREAIQKGDK